MATSEKRTLSIEARMKDSFTRPLSGIEKRLAQFATGSIRGLKSLGSAFLSVKSALVGLAAAYGGLRALQAVRTFGEQTDAMIKLAKSTGDLVENLSEVSAAAELAGVKQEEFTGILRALSTAARQASQGNVQYADAFAAIGLSLQDLQQLGPSQILERISAGLEKFGSEQQKAIALGRILPRQFLDLLPLVGRGLGEYQKAVKEARAAGATITEGQAKRAEELNDALTKAQLAIASVGRGLIEAFGPKATYVLEEFAKTIVANREQVVSLAKALAEGLAKAISAVADGFINLIGVIELIPGVNLAEDVHLEKQIEAAEFAAIKAGGNVARAKTAAEKAALQEQFQLALKHEADLKAMRKESLSIYLRDQKAQFEKHFAELTASIQASTASNPPMSPTDLGAPDEDAWRKYAEDMAEAMRKAFGDAKPFESVHAKPSGGGGLPDQDSGETNKLVSEREKLAVQQQILQLQPNLRTVQGQLIDIEARGQVLSFEDAAARGVINTKELEAAIALVKARTDEAKEANSGFFGGLHVAAKKAIDDWTDFAKQGAAAAQTLVSDGLDGLVDALGSWADGTKKAGQAFRDLAKSVISDIERIVIKLAVSGLINYFTSSNTTSTSGSGANTFSAERGGVHRVGKLYDMRSFAAGGVATRPTLGLFGEGRNAEAFVPLPDNRHIPVMFTGGDRGGGQTNVLVQIHAMDSKDVRRALQENQSTLRAIFTNQAERQHGMRQVIRKVSA